MIDRQLQFTTLAAAEEESMRLAHAKTLATQAAWNLSQTLVHCAQSVEYSMNGFPALKPVLFQRTLGALALGMFTRRGHMSHKLSEPIPGAPLIAASADPLSSLKRLRTAIRQFQQWKGPLQPHFAYGALDKPAYERAHAMHLANHLSAFDAKA